MINAGMTKEDNPPTFDNSASLADNANNISM